MKTTIYIRDLYVRTHVWCSDREINEERSLTVSVRVEAEVSAAFESDNLHDTVDYVQISNDILSYCKTARHQLLEHFAAIFVKKILSYEKVKHVWVRIDKAYIPMDFASVGVELEASK